MSTLGPTYDPDFDRDRLRRQHYKIRDLMIDGYWRTLHEIAESLGFPEASISAQLRHLRKPEFGSYDVQKRRLAGGLWAYRVLDQTRRFSGGTQGELLELPEVPMKGH